MVYLADTHVVIWLFETPEKLPNAWLAIFDSVSDVYVSSASFWEIAIKAGVGKLDATPAFAAHVLANGFKHLPIALSHIAHLHAMPHVDGHRDPFDRMLIAQAIVEDMTIMSVDRKFSAYDVSLV